MGGGDALKGAVFGDGAAGDDGAFGREGLGEGVVGQGFVAVFAGDEIAEAGAQGGGGEGGSRLAPAAGREEGAQPERAAWRIDAGAGDDAADGAFMQAKRGGDIGHGHRDEKGGAAVERGFLTAQHLLPDAQEGGVARLDQAQKGAGGALALTASGGHVERGQGGAVQRDGPAVIAAPGDEIGFADGRGEMVELCAGFGVQRAEGADGLGDGGFGGAEFAGEAGGIVGGDQIEIVDNTEQDGVDRGVGQGLKTQAFRQRAGEEACGFDLVEAGEDGFDLWQGQGGLSGDPGQRLAEPAGRFQRLGQSQCDAGVLGREALTDDPVGDMGDQAGGGGLGPVGRGVGVAEHAVPARQPVACGWRADLEGGVFCGLFFEIAGETGGIGLKEAQRGLQSHREVQPLGCGDFDPLIGGHGVF